MSSRSANTVALIALGAGLAMATALFAGHAVSGAAILSACAVQAVAGATIAALLLFGGRRIDAKNDEDLDFWGFVAPILPLSLAAGTAIFEGATRFYDAQIVVEPRWAFAALGISAIFAGIAFWSVAAELQARSLSVRKFPELRAAGEPVLFALLVQSIATLAGIGIATLGVVAAYRFEAQTTVAVATTTVGLIMAAVAALLANEARSLISRPKRNVAVPLPRDADTHNAHPVGEPLTVVPAVAESGSATHPPPGTSRKSRKKLRRSAR